jgi:uncharacterized protein
MNTTEQGRMAQRVSLITLGFADLGRARSFYEALGWTAAAETEPDADIVFYEGLGMIIALWDRGKLAKDTAVSDNGGSSWAHSVGSRQEVDAILSRGERAGGRSPVPEVRRSGAATPVSSSIPAAIPGRSRTTPIGRSTTTARSASDAARLRGIPVGVFLPSSPGTHLFSRHSLATPDHMVFPNLEERITTLEELDSRRIPSSSLPAHKRVYPLANRGH